MKGIILAGGAGTRLYPITRVMSKQLLPVFNKPMIYYPLSTLMMAGIQEILVISTPADLDRFRDLLGDGTQWGLTFEYLVQPEPDGLPQAFVLGRDFIGDDHVALILGDNLFYGHGLSTLLRDVALRASGATIFGYYVKDPSRYGVAELDGRNRVIGLMEKPRNPPSNWAVTGLYFYDNDVVEIAENLEPSDRGEYEITDVNLAYLRQGKLQMEFLGRGMAWLDTGTHESLHQAASYIETLEQRQGLMVACPEEIAFRQGFIDREMLLDLARPMQHNDYGRYLVDLAEASRGTPEG